MPKPEIAPVIIARPINPSHYGPELLVMSERPVDKAEVGRVIIQLLEGVDSQTP